MSKTNNINYLYLFLALYKTATNIAHTINDIPIITKTIDTYLFLSSTFIICFFIGTVILTLLVFFVYDPLLSLISNKAELEIIYSSLFLLLYLDKSSISFTFVFIKNIYSCP